MELIIESRLSRFDYIKINLHIAFRKPTFYLSVVATVVLTAVALVSANYLFLLVWAWFAFVAAPPLYRTLRATFSRKNASFFLPTKRTFSDRGVQTESPKSSGMVYWNSFVAWRRTPGHYLLFINPRSFVGIPRSKVPDIAAFEKLLRTKIRPAQKR